MNTERLNCSFITEDEEKKDYELTPFCNRKYWTTLIIFALCVIIPSIVAIVVAFVVPLYSTECFPKDNAVPYFVNSTIIMDPTPPPINKLQKSRSGEESYNNE